MSYVMFLKPAWKAALSFGINRNRPETYLWNIPQNKPLKHTPRQTGRAGSIILRNFHVYVYAHAHLYLCECICVIRLPMYACMYLVLVWHTPRQCHRMELSTTECIFLQHMHVCFPTCSMLGTVNLVCDWLRVLPVTAEIFTCAAASHRPFQLRREQGKRSTK